MESSWKNNKNFSSGNQVNKNRRSLKQKFESLSQEFSVLQETNSKLKNNLSITLNEIDERDLILNDYEAEYKRFLQTQKLIRGVDEVYIIDI